MSGDRHVRIRGRQREQIDADLLAQLVVLLGRQLARGAGPGREVGHSDGDDLDAASLLAREGNHDNADQGERQEPAA